MLFKIENSMEEVIFNEYWKSTKIQVLILNLLLFFSGIEDKLDGFFTVESKEGNPFFEHFLYQNDEISDQDSVNLLGVNDDQDFLARDGQQLENGTCISDIICDESTKEVKNW